MMGEGFTVTLSCEEHCEVPGTSWLSGRSSCRLACWRSEVLIMHPQRLYERIRPSGRIARSAKIFVGPKLPVIACILVDYSAGGACIQLENYPDLPQGFDLIYGTTRKRCRIVWKRALRVGLPF